MTDKEKYDFIDHVVHLTIFVEDRLLDEHGGEYSGLEEDGIDSNEYYRIIIERVINILKKNNNYMQEEPVSIWHDKGEEPDEDRQVLINLSGYCYVDFYHKEDKRFYMFGNPKHYLCEVDRWAYIDDILKLSNVQRTTKNWKEPVSEELEEAMQHNAPDNIGIDDLLYWRNGFITGAKWQKEKEYTCYEEAFEDGAKWKAEQFEKNRLTACDRQTEEEAEIERDFVTSIIEKEHRQPTFDDAIKYGMRLQKEQMMKNAISLKVKETFGKGDEVAWVIRPSKILDKKFNVGEKVKVIVIKED